MKSHPYVTEYEWNVFRGIAGGGIEAGSELPKLGVLATEADEYCAWAGGRLPTDVELDGQFCPIWEWTSTQEDKYRIARGGSWNFSPDGCRASFRNRYLPDYRNDYIGFRCVRERA